MMILKTWLRPAVALVAGLALLVGATACGDDDADPQAAPPEGESDQGADGSAPAQDAEEVEVAPGLTVTPDESVQGTLRLAYGDGIIHSPEWLMEELNLLETMYPSLDVRWSNIVSTNDQRDAMLANQLDIGFATTGPFLQALDAGVDWRFIQIFNGFDGGIAVSEGGPGNLEEFAASDEQISPGANTSQHYAMQQLLLNEGLSSDALDDQLTQVPHPDAYALLTSGQIGAHFGTADWTERAQQDGFQTIGTFREAYDGQYISLGWAAMSDYIDDNPDIVEALRTATQEVLDWIDSDPEAVADLMAERYDQDPETRELMLSTLDSDWVIFPGQGDFTTGSGSINAIGGSMLELGLLESLPEDPSEVYAFVDEVPSEW